MTYCRGGFHTDVGNTVDDSESETYKSYCCAYLLSIIVSEDETSVIVRGVGVCCQGITSIFKSCNTL